ncbi:MAG: hypothetical protein C4521_09030 [Actinobacteria bacterium]|nr:MAG: hypothetical protein C4521_09030 [Actinomycetota bacterium]
MLWLAIGAPAWVIVLAYVLGLLAGAVMLYDLASIEAERFPGGREGKLVWVVLFLFSIGLGLQPFVPIAYWLLVFRNKELPEVE